MLQLEAILVEQIVLQRRVQMRKPARYRACSDANVDRPLARPCQIRIGLRPNRSIAYGDESENYKQLAYRLTDANNSPSSNGGLRPRTLYH